eukprot:4315328-Pyramimonas_sp.AAC.1
MSKVERIRTHATKRAITCIEDPTSVHPVPPPRPLWAWCFAMVVDGLACLSVCAGARARVRAHDRLGPPQG